MKIKSTDRILAIIDEMGKQRFFVSNDIKTPFDDDPKFHGDEYIKPSDWDDVKVNMLMTEEEQEEESLEVYSKNQDAVLSLIKREKKYNFLGELANTYGELAHEVNNRIELTKMMDPGAIAIAVQLLLASFELIEKAAFNVKETTE